MSKLLSRFWRLELECKECDGNGYINCHCGGGGKFCDECLGDWELAIPCGPCGGWGTEYWTILQLIKRKLQEA